MEAIYMDQITPLFIFSKTFEEVRCHFFLKKNWTQFDIRRNRNVPGT